ncbi:putative amidoligase enzyme-domain-containing protein [Rhexocercosporidium sp. MPI-PUGE-AT-0058]|nr:putative amidoligase enzyme-domain-containing protein [Rhexocercosporidium sp. MPI-PUGE-AT-0058]
MSSYSSTPSPKDGPDGSPDYEIIPRPALTFGFELEFGIVCLPQDYEDPNPEDSRQVYGILEKDPPLSPRIPSLGLHEPYQIGAEDDEWWHIQQHIASTLRKQGLLAFSDEDETQTDFDTENSWIIKDDASIKPPPLNYKFRDVELVSPPFYFSEKALNEVRVVCETLPSEYRLFTNTSCSIHVHVGNGTNGFTVSHLRKLMAILWAFEPQFDSLHPHHRVGPTRYSGSLREHSKLAIKLKARGMTARDGLQRIYDTQDINEIVDILDSPKLKPGIPFNQAYRLMNLVEEGTADSYEDFSEAEDSKKTIEFRHHEGTFDAEAVDQWIRLCVHLVEFAEEVRPDRLRAWLEEHIDTEFNVIQILEAIKLPLAASYYEKKLAERASLGPDRSTRIAHPFAVELLEESMVTDHIRQLSDLYCKRWDLYE